MSNYLQLKKFSEIDINDVFFDSLKNDYEGFEQWFHSKKEHEAYILEGANGIDGFLYLKYENGPVMDTSPSINAKKILKIGTLKINPHGTRLGERFIKKAMDFAAIGGVDCIYVTIFEHHSALMALFKKYGFVEYGSKGNNGEKVLLKDFKTLSNDVLLDYPLINSEGNEKYLLAIYPQYHSVMFPDSILNNEKVDILSDVTITNSIHKIYVSTMPLYKLNRGDALVMYRTGSGNVAAEYSAVATSICIVEEVKSQDEFSDFETFYSYASTYSIFDKADLRKWYLKGKCYAVKMTYNAALSKRLNRKKIADDIGLDRKDRWSFLKLTDNQFRSILEEGEISESLIIN